LARIGLLLAQFLGSEAFEVLATFHHLGVILVNLLSSFHFEEFITTTLFVVFVIFVSLSESILTSFWLRFRIIAEATPKVLVTTSLVGSLVLFLHLVQLGRPSVLDVQFHTVTPFPLFAALLLQAGVDQHIFKGTLAVLVARVQSTVAVLFVPEQFVIQTGALEVFLRVVGILLLAFTFLVSFFAVIRTGFE
jgi:hypothetical protein